MIGRRRGVNVRGRDLGSSNRSVHAAMDNIKTIGDLCQLRALKHESSALLVTMAADELVRQHLIPPAAAVTKEAVIAAWRCVRRYPEEDTRGLYTKLRAEATGKPMLRAYVDLVTRIWLICPMESVVESMASVIADIFGDHRQLDHENATKELQIRWNGPAPERADPLVDLLQRRCSYRFERTSTVGVLASADGTVIQRLGNKRCPRETIFCSQSYD